MNKKNTIIVIILLFVVLMVFVLIKVYCIKINKSFRQKYKINYDINQIKYLEESLDIIEIKYNWTEPLVMENRPYIIIYHHTAINEISAEEIDTLHKGKGWKGIGYHYFIRKNGDIYIGRPEAAEGSHACNNNFISIGIAVEGNFEEEYLTIEQMKSIVKLSEYLCIKYDIKDVIGHNAVGNTLCPGKNFPLVKIREELIKNLKELGKSIN